MTAALTIAVRGALYIDFMLLFGLPMFVLYVWAGTRGVAAARHRAAPLLAVALVGRRDPAVAAVAGDGLRVDGGAGDGTAGAIQLMADIVHLLTAGVWIGALSPQLSGS